MADAIELVHADQGSGNPTFVLIHGLCCDLTDWQPQLAALSQTNRVITPTLRGHGSDNGSDNGSEGRSASTLTMENLATDVVALLRAKGVTSAIIGGHSMGTRVVHEVRHQAPDIVKGIMLVDGSDSAFGDLDAAIAGFEAATADGQLKHWLQGLFEIMFYGDAFAELREACIKRALAMPDDNLRALYTNMMTWDATKGDAIMRAVDVPTLVIQSTTRGEDGIRRALRDGEMGHYPDLVKTRIPAADFALLTGHGHFTGLEAPDWTNDAITSWAKQHGLM